MEKLNLLESSNGTVLHSEIVGAIKMKVLSVLDCTVLSCRDKLIMCQFMLTLYPNAYVKPILRPVFAKARVEECEDSTMVTVLRTRG